MHAIAPCMQCFSEGLRPDPRESSPEAMCYPPSEYPQIELDKWPYYEFRCPNGHLNRAILQNELYELLFQQAVYCIDDGYYRESIGTFNAALERYIEFATEVLSYRINADFEFEHLWKSISNQSERQLGAFHIVYQLALGIAPQKLNEKKVKLRNAVVHKGKLASKEEALGFSQYVMDYIRDSDENIEKRISRDDYCDICFARLRRLWQKDLVKAWDKPIKLMTEKGPMYQGPTSCPYQTFIKNKSLLTIQDCLGSKPPYLGLRK